MNRAIAPQLTGYRFLLFLWLIFPLYTQACIGVIPSGAGSFAFWKAVNDGAQAAGREFGEYIYFRGPNDEDNVDAQKNIIRYIESKRCIGLVLAPNNPSLAEEVARLKAKGIPTVYIDRDTGNAEVIGIVSSNNFNAGKLAARKMGELLGGKGSIAIMDLQPDVVSTRDRVQGFTEQAKALGLTISVHEYVGMRIGDIRTNSLQILQNIGQSLDGVFTPNETTTYGVLATLRQGKHRPVFVGFDINDNIKEAVKLGEIAGVITQRPFEMGYTAIQLIHDYYHTEHTARKTIYIDVDFVTQADLLADNGKNPALSAPSKVPRPEP